MTLAGLPLIQCYISRTWCEFVFAPNVTYKQVLPIHLHLEEWSLRLVPNSRPNSRRIMFESNLQARSYYPDRELAFLIADFGRIHLRQWFVARWISK